MSTTVSLSLYNYHKRRTLDRLTLKYQMQIREVLRQKTEETFNAILESLHHGRREFDTFPVYHAIAPRIRNVYEKHAENVTHVAIADGIQEVSPENKLNLWANFPIDQPIETTLSINLASKNKTIAETLLEERQTLIARRVFLYTKNTADVYLQSIRKAYAKSAFEWFNGGATADDVKSYLQKALEISDNDAERTLRTETTNYFNESRNSYFRVETDVDYIELYAVTDGRISKICEDRHGFVIPIAKSHQKQYMPAFHPNCRTVQRPLFSVLPSHEAIIKAGLEMNEASFTPLPKGWA
jgi:SPP1 gp7 family putative phage head morphogenesis protein